jgi:anti-sigma B factor antagonist
VRLSGDIDYLTAPFFRDPILEKIALGPRRVVLDLDAVPFCDSAGLNALVLVYGTVAEAEAELVDDNGA